MESGGKARGRTGRQAPASRRSGPANAVAARARSSAARTSGQRQSAARSKPGAATQPSGPRSGRRKPVYYSIDGISRNVTPKSLLQESAPRRDSDERPADADAAIDALTRDEADAPPEATLSGAEAPPAAPAPSAAAHGLAAAAAASLGAEAGPGRTLGRLGARRGSIGLGMLARGESHARAPVLGPLEVRLCETPTETMLHIPSRWEASDSRSVDALREQNAAYEALLALKMSSDRFSDRYTQTLDLSTKEKGVACQPPALRDAACSASTWDIHDTYAGAAAGGRSGTADAASQTAGPSAASALDEEVRRTVSVTLARGCLLDVSEATSPEKLSELAPGASGPAAAPEGSRSVAVGAGTAAPAAADGLERALDAEDIFRKRHFDEILSSERLHGRALVVERMLQQGNYHERHRRYRNKLDGRDGLRPRAAAGAPSGPSGAAETMQATATAATAGTSGPPAGSAARPASATDADTGPETGSAPEDVRGARQGRAPAASLELLWKHACEATEGRTVSCLAWSRGNPDLVAVGYGELYFDRQGDGLVLFWSLRNPEYPERTLRLPSGVTAIDFSRRSPCYVAVGTYDGRVMIFDTRRGEVAMQAPVLESQAVEGQQHMEPVWQVRWVDRRERGEALVSISTDGRVWEWSTKKGLAISPLMELKRFGDTEGVISRTASGLCLDFPGDDDNVYIAGTEDGYIHRCSCSYNEAYLESYQGHSGPVYTVAFSPFCPSFFLSSAADWTVRLWSDRSTKAAMEFHPVDLSDVVNDVAWSPFEPCVFASATGDGRVALWDFERSPHDPLSTWFAPEATVEDTSPEEELPDPLADGPKGPAGRAPTAATQDSGIARPFSGKLKARSEPEAERTPRTKLERPALTCIAFSNNAPVLAVGDAHGGVSIFRLAGARAGAAHAGARSAEDLERVRARMNRAVFAEDGEDPAAA